MLVSDSRSLRHILFGGRFAGALAVVSILLATALPDAARAETIPTLANDPNPPPAGPVEPEPPAPEVDGTYNPLPPPAATNTAAEPPTAPVPPNVPPAEEPATPPAATPTPTPTAPTVAPTTRWEPFDREAARTADGSLDVCATMVFPLTFVPGVGDIVGTISDWLCIVPAALAVDYVGTWHGGRESHFWQPVLALVLKKVWETVLDTPIMVVTIGIILGGTVGAAPSPPSAACPSPSSPLASSAAPSPATSP